MAKFIESVLEAYEARERPFEWAQGAGDSVPRYILRTDQMMASFHPSALKIRCLAWIYWDMFTIQGRILASAATILQRYEGFRRGETPLIVKLFTVPHIVLLPVWRLTFDVMEDLFAAEKPAYLIPAVQHLVAHSAGLSLHFCLDENLAEYFRKAGNHVGAVDGKSVPAFQRWVEGVVREGMDSQSIRDLWSCMHE